MELYFDIDLCVGCHACELACALQNHGEKRINIEVFGGLFPLSGVCRQCENSPCVQVCPKEAIKRTGDAVKINENLCIGCRSCSIACPFGNIDFLESRRVSVKCDECLGRLKEGERPPCARVCPTGALRFCEYEEMEKVASTAKRRREMVGPRIFAWRPK
ncbi:MAG: 4Fe-4S dicluster domain-containing protein [Candidatus Hadarchaeales archaeon]